MKEIKRMRADFYQFNSHNLERSSIFDKDGGRYSTFSYVELDYYLHYLSNKVNFNLPEAQSTWPKVQINWCSNENMTFGQNEKTLNSLVFVNKHAASEKKNFSEAFFHENRANRVKARASLLWGWGMARGCRECSGVWSVAREDVISVTMSRKLAILLHKCRPGMIPF